MSEASNNEQREQREQLLTAYLDDELSPKERAHVELILTEFPKEAIKLQQWRDNGKAIRELPRFRLDDEFAARVLAATEFATVEYDDDDSNANVHRAEAENDNARIGIGAIAALAAMLLLTLFVFPSMVGSKVAVNQPEKTGTSEVTLDENATSNVDPILIDQQPIIRNQQPVIGVRNSSLPTARKTGRAVDPINLGNFSRPGVERVMWVENQTLSSLERIFANHAIKIVDPENKVQDQVHLVAQSSDRVEAVYVVATADSMKNAIAEMASESNCSVTAFPLPEGNQGVEPSESSASAQQIIPLDLTQKGTDANEITSLDKWFGLVDDADESRMIQYLLLLNPAR